MTDTFVERRAGRAIVVDRRARVLMILGRDPGDPHRGRFLWTPGGGVDGEETVPDATRRELREEVGLHTDELGPVVLQRIGEFPFDGRRVRQVEQYYHVHSAPDFEPRPTHRSELEARAIVDLVWLTSTELRRSDVPFYPWCLADLVDHIAEHGPPDEPWFEEQRLDHTGGHHQR